jgi:hypothetical protein
MDYDSNFFLCVVILAPCFDYAIGLLSNMQLGLFFELSRNDL